jgi:hypothetical protein
MKYTAAQPIKMFRYSIAIDLREQHRPALMTVKTTTNWDTTDPLEQHRFFDLHGVRVSAERIFGTRNVQACRVVKKDTVNW